MRLTTWPVLLLAGLLLTACASVAEAPHTTQSVTPTDFPSTPAASTTPLAAADIPYPSDLTMGTVTHVVDGDTIDVEINGQTLRVRYIGMDTPETVDPNRPIGCYGHEASDHNTEFVLNKIVGLEKDVSETDDFGRLLRYVWVGYEMVNAALVRDGYALAKAYPPDTKHQAAFEALQGEAQEAHRGLWAACANATPIISTTQTPPPGSGDRTCGFSGTNQAVIKGNISSSDEKIYHVPGQNSYDATGITESRGERWFCTEQEAVDAGWRKSKS